MHYHASLALWTPTTAPRLVLVLVRALELELVLLPLVAATLMKCVWRSRC